MSSPVPGRGAVASAVTARRRRSVAARRRRRRLWVWVAVAVAGSLGAFTAGLFAAPLDYSYVPPPPQAVQLTDVHGRVFAEIPAPQDREPVSSAQIPAVLKQAIVAAEDERFFSHRGVDPLALARAVWRDVSGGAVEGGSTITQQYVKNVYTGSERTAFRKIREASLALRLETHLSKDAILTRYLNTLYLGNGTAGVQAASRYYFGVPVQDLDLDPRTGRRSPELALARAATLVGFVPAPSVWNPVADPREARVRELYVLNQMVRTQRITPQQASAAYGDALPPVVAHAVRPPRTVAPEFRDYVAEQLRGTLAFPDTTLFDSGGTRVRTTLDLDLQRAAVAALHGTLRHRGDPEAAVVAVDPRNGDIRALATRERGGYVPDGFDLATDARRSSGSTIKPFTLALALLRGHSLDEVRVAPQPCTDVPYHVCNAETGSRYQTLRSALVESINTVYGPLAVQLGLQRVVRLARAAGMQVGPLVHDGHGRLFPGQALGIPVSPLSEAVAYGTLVDGGVHHSPRSVLGVRTAADGTLYSAPADPGGERALPAGVADRVRDVLRQVVDDGTGIAARQPFPVYGKTGTTDDFTNAWFTGCTPTLCVAVWMGYDREYVGAAHRPHAMRDVEGVPQVYGGTLPARIFAATLQGYRDRTAADGSAHRSPPHRSEGAAPRVTAPVRPRPAPSAPAPSGPPEGTPTAAATRAAPTGTPAPGGSRSTAPSASPSPAPSLTLLPSPRGQPASRDNVAT